MAITIDWGARIINVPRGDLELIQQTPTEIRQLNLNDFRLALKDLEDSEEGEVFPDTHSHNPEVTVGGVTLARVVQIINGYTVTFEDGQYAVNLVGANSNVGDVVNVNQVSVRSANSAGMTSSQDIEFASYENCVTVDMLSSYSGTAHPKGTKRQPVNNMADAKLIADFRGLMEFQFVGDAVIDTTGDYSGMIFRGSSMTKSEITIMPSANVYKAEFYDCTLEGTLDGQALARNCMIDQLEYINGIIEDCLLGGDPDSEAALITLGGNARATFLNCWSGAEPSGLPIIDMGGSGQELIIRNYSGGLRLRNKTGAEEVSITLQGGTIVLEDTVTTGPIKVSGIGVVTDGDGVHLRSGTWNGSVQLTLDDLLSTEPIQQIDYNGAVTVDPLSSYTGTVYPVGTARAPVNNIVDAYAIATARGLQAIVILNETTLTVPLRHIAIVGMGSMNNCVVNLNNQLLDSVFFKHCTLRGKLNAVRSSGAGWASSVAFVEFEQCYLDDIEDLEGDARMCQVEGLTKIKSNGWFSSTDTVVEGDYTFFDLGNAPSAVSMDVNSGWAQFINVVDGCLIELNDKGGEITLHPSCVGGEFYAEGIGHLYNESTMTIKTNELLESRMEELVHDNPSVEQDPDNPTVRLSFREAMKLVTAAAAGKVSGATGGTVDERVSIRNALVDSKTRMRALVDRYGNRKEVDIDTGN